MLQSCTFHEVFPIILENYSSPPPIPSSTWTPSWSWTINVPIKWTCDKAKTFKGFFEGTAIMEHLLLHKRLLSNHTGLRVQVWGLSWALEGHACLGLGHHPCLLRGLWRHQNCSMSMNWRAPFRPSLLSVGAFVSMCPNPGSSYPRITSRAFARNSLLPGKGFFQVRIHRDLINCSGASVPFASFLTLPWSTHALTSLCLASSNNLFFAWGLSSYTALPHVASLDCWP